MLQNKKVCMCAQCQYEPLETKNSPREIQPTDICLQEM